jgi:hypothetical protein
MFIAFDTQAHTAIFPLIFLMYLIDILFTHKNTHNRMFNRLLAYKLLGLVGIIALTAAYIA